MAGKLSQDSTHQDKEDSELRKSYDIMLQNGELEDRLIDIKGVHRSLGIEIISPSGMDDISDQLQDILQNIQNDDGRSRKIKIRDARTLMLEEEAQHLIKEEEIRQQAIEHVAHCIDELVPHVDDVECHQPTQNNLDKNNPDIKLDDGR